MKDLQLHEIAMLALSKSEFRIKNNPVGLAKEIFQNYNTIIDSLKILNKNLDDGCEINVFGMAQTDDSCAKNER